MTVAEGVQPPKKKRKPAKARRKPDAAIRLVVMPDGSFRCFDDASRLACKARKFGAGEELIAYLYRDRSYEQWLKAHGLGMALIQNVEAFENCATAHAAVKKMQTDGEIALTIETFDLGNLGKVIRSVPKSLAFDEMDEAEFQEIYGAMIKYVRDKYWGGLDEIGQHGLARLLGVGS